MQAAVVIVGSDPVGSLLAGEPRLSGVGVVLLAQQAAPGQAEPPAERPLDRACRLGAELRRGCRLVELARDRSGVDLLVAGSGGRIELRAGYPAEPAPGGCAGRRRPAAPDADRARRPADCRPAAGQPDQPAGRSLRAVRRPPSAARLADARLAARPDGHVAWASPDGGDLDSSLCRWFGPPQPVLARPAGLLAANW